MFERFLIIIVTLALAAPLSETRASKFVSVRNHQFYLNAKPYYFVGANYWYGSLLPLEKDNRRGIERLRKELGFLKANGITNLRLMAGAEGSGMMNGVMRVGPPLQPEQGKFDESVLSGLDMVLAEMSKRRMRAVIFLSNNWEWSGGFQQYLIWNRVITDEWLTKKPSWDELRDNIAKFYSCEPCKQSYEKQLRYILGRRNKYSKKKYVDDPTIMAWEIANEPRPMLPFADNDYRRWVSDTASTIKSLDKNHLVTIGQEGWIGTEDIGLYEAIHANKNVDYMTIHIWPKNWGWFADGKMSEGFENVVEQTAKYMDENVAVAKRLNRPMVIEEFGLPRDGQSFDPASTTSFRDHYYAMVLSFIGGQGVGDEYIAGANFWAFAGTARPKTGQAFWKIGDDYTGDPPMEEQGLNSVFDSDRTTWETIRSAVKKIARQADPKSRDPG